MAKGRERSAKWYFRNEREVLEELGLTPTKGSGSSWIEKEDGYNDHVIAQLKSTDKESYKLNKLDLEKLEYNAIVSGKIPMFVIQFLKDDSRYALVAIEDIPKIAEYINTGNIEHKPVAIEMPSDEEPKNHIKKVRSSSKARDSFYKEKEKQFEKRKWK